MAALSNVVALGVDVPDGIPVVVAQAKAGLAAAGLVGEALERPFCVVIPNGLTVVPDGAFERCTGLVSVIMPVGVNAIGKSSFAECTRLTSLTIPDGIIVMGMAAFGGCIGLTSVTIRGWSPPPILLQPSDNGPPR